MRACVLYERERERERETARKHTIHDPAQEREKDKCYVIVILQCQEEITVCGNLDLFKGHIERYIVQKLYLVYILAPAKPILTWLGCSDIG